MISKEEMKEALRVGDDRTVIEYIEQIENKVRIKDEALKEFGQAVKDMCSDKQKLIDKLKEKIKYFEECDELMASSNDNYSDGTVTYRFIKEFTEILSIAKGEKKNEKRENNRTSQE